MLLDSHFNPRAPCGARLRHSNGRFTPVYFNPRAPCGARLPKQGRSAKCLRFQSTRPVRGATGSCRSGHTGRGISIHAPRAGRDGGPAAVRVFTRNFNPRAPCGARRCDNVTAHKPVQFQSTRPVRGATLPCSWIGGKSLFQSTRPVRGATEGPNYCHFPREFQSTRPVRGATRGSCRCTGFHPQFQSTRPVRGATWMLSTGRCMTV